jgi:glycosyltransferase involved in cell wall biosynthesis
VHDWSGLTYHIHQALLRSGLQVQNIEAGAMPRDMKSISKGFIYRKIFSRKYLAERDPSIAKLCSDQIEQTLRSVECNVVFSPGTIPIAYLETAKPIIFWADATFAGMVDFYPEYTNLCSETIRHGNELEQSALARCTLAIYSSEWAANTAVQNYDVDPSKVRVVPFGANLDCSRDFEDVARSAGRKAFNVIKLLFVGVDWFRKGGDIALKVAALLNEHGTRTELHVVGCTPDLNLPDFVKVHGFISKTTEEGRRKLDELFAESHFLILPARAECFGLVLAEANSFGVPCLATNVGGISTALKDDINGKLFPAGAGPEAYSEYIVSSKSDYRRLALSSFREFSERLNWSTAARDVRSLIHEFCLKKASVG